ncbi:MAG: hypothetical protein KJ720_15315 [Proteobacteria bacterium]|nr:hypothetical protein [Pseudomonadota bacterium]MBU1451774.1 hypothetical protein [Pseudomonadota bacterium]MBU2468524.1 hypothetical protein [Pseudomonadota bacterium]MBU2519161.1 hypothetical protein [Pseudomonadota bacterium]
MGRFRSLVSPEAVALLSVICIVALFLGAHYQREMDRKDQQALKVAQKVYQILTPAPAPGQTTDQKPGAASPKALREKLAQALKDPAPVKVEVLDDPPGAWQVLVWHPQGVERYVVTPQGVTQGVR